MDLFLLTLTPHRQPDKMRLYLGLGVRRVILTLQINKRHKCSIKEFTLDHSLLCAH